MATKRKSSFWGSVGRGFGNVIEFLADIFFWWT